VVLENLREDPALMSAVICLKNHILLFYCIHVNVSGLRLLSNVFYSLVQNIYIVIEKKVSCIYLIKKNSNIVMK